MPFFEVQLTTKLQRLYDVGPDTVIGRAPQCQIQLLSRAVSRRHARIEFDGNQAIVSDLGTKNGIKLNGQRIQGAAVVSEGDILLVGDIRMQYRTADRSIVAADVIDLRNRAAHQGDLQAAVGPKATFLLRASPEAIDQFQSGLGRSRLAQLDFDELSRFKLQIALKEGLDNARRHGCAGDANRFLYVTFREDEDEFLMSIKDDGPGFAVEQVLQNTTEVDALSAVRERANMGGPLGLRIILNCVDRVQFEGRGTTIHMGKFKEAAQMIVISDDDISAVEEPSSEELAGFHIGGPAPTPPSTGPFGEPIGGLGDPFAGLGLDEPAQPGPDPFSGGDPLGGPGGLPPGGDPFGTGGISMDDLLP